MSTEEQAVPFGNYQYEIYLKGLAEKLPSIPIEYYKLEAAAKEKLPPESFDYAAGGVVERLGRQLLLGGCLELVVLDRDRGELLGETLEVDLVLVVAEGDGLLLGAHARRLYAPGRREPVELC